MPYRPQVRRAVMLVALTSGPTLAQGNVDFTWSKQLPGGARLAIQNINGPIEVRPATGDRVNVRAVIVPGARGNSRDISFDVREHAANDVEICTVYRGRNDCDRNHRWNDGDGDIRVTVRYVVEVPKTIRLRPATGNGDITVSQTVAEVDAATGNGAVQIRESLGRVGASSGNGDIEILNAAGPVKASTGNGRIVATAATGPIDASTGNGDIQVRMGAVPRGSEMMSFSTGSGSVSVTLPSTFNGEVDASTGMGSIDSDFELRVRGRMSTSRLRGTIGDGNGPVLRMRSGNGRLEVRKG